MAAGGVIEVQFKVQARIRHGEEIRLSGNHPSLGCDNVDRAIPLVTSPKEFPWWWNKEAIFLPQAHADLRYRYAVFSGGKFVRFEGGGKLSRSLRFEFSDDTTHSVCDILDDGPLAETQPSQPGILMSTYSRENRARQFNDIGRTSNLSIRVTDSVVVISYFLPVIVKKENGIWTAQRNLENILSFETDLNVSWIGSLQVPGSILSSEDEEAISNALKPLNCYPVFISKEIHKKFYNGICKEHLWPVMHHHSEIYGVTLKGLDRQTEKNLWFVYNTVNQLFAKKVVEVYQRDDLIWIHGFHLMLLPYMIRRKIIQAKMGFYLHTPFPSSEIWKTLWCREDLLQGVLCADQIGFHLYEYARHFLTACRRVLGTHYEYTSTGVLEIQVLGRRVVVTCMHVGVHLDHIQTELHSDEFLAEVNKWEKKFEDKTVIASIDRLEKLKAIPLKLTAIGQFLAANSNYLDKVVFVVIGITASERGEDYLQTRYAVNTLVASLNRKYPNSIYYEERKENEMKLVQRVALFYVSDVLMVTAVRDGLNRLPMEYTLTRSTMKNPGENHEGRSTYFGSREGVVILSEFVSSARVMGGAIIINPWKIDEVIEAILRSLEMHQTERTARFRRNLEFCSRMTTLKWAENVLQDLKNVELSDLSSATLGLGVNCRVVGIRADLLPLDVVKLSKAYRSSQYRLLLFDWGGTLTDTLDTYEAYAIATGHSRAGPSEELIQILQSLCDDPRNYCFVISGRAVHSMQDYFGSIERLGLAAEHGCYYRFPSKDKSGASSWTTSIALETTDWMDSVRRIMDIYTQRTHGSYIEQKGAAMIWQFRDADPDFGYLQSKELEEHLSDILSSYPLDIIRGGGVSDGYLEIRPAGLSKGLFLNHITSTLKSKGITIDFLLTIGDDITDEPMFETANRLCAAKKVSFTPSIPSSSTSTVTSLPSNKLEVFTVSVGKRFTVANTYVNDSAEVLDVLRALNKTKATDKRYMSSVDLSCHQKANLATFIHHAATLTPSSRSPMPRSNSESQITALSPRPSFVELTTQNMPSEPSAGSVGQYVESSDDFAIGAGDGFENGEDADNFF